MHPLQDYVYCDRHVIMNRSTSHIMLAWLLGDFRGCFGFFVLSRRGNFPISFYLYEPLSETTGCAYIFQPYFGDTLFLGFLQEEWGPKALWKGGQCWESPSPGPGCSLGAPLVRYSSHHWTVSVHFTCPAFPLHLSPYRMYLSLTPVLEDLLLAS